jgi:hypothetical protein
MSFEIGDEVIVTEGYHYRWTKQGSLGIVKEISEDYGEVFVEFYKLTSDFYTDVALPVSFWIRVIDLDLFTSQEKAKKDPYAHINRKVRQMYQRRKEKGYAF